LKTSYGREWLKTSGYRHIGGRGSIIAPKTVIYLRVPKVLLGYQPGYPGTTTALYLTVAVNKWTIITIGYH